jgi:hypothetical protein
MNSDLSCPRCGYDQSGVVSAWERSEPPCCPLRGTCSECGFEFEWREVFSEHRIRLRWLYEHRRGPAPIAAWKTWARALHPARFWAGVGMRRVHPWRLLAWLAVLLLTIYLATGGLHTVVAWWTYHKHPGMVSNWQYLPWYGSGWSWPFFSFIVGAGWSHVSWNIRFWPACFWSSAAMSLGWVLGLLCLGSRGPGWTHILRAWVYSHAWLIMLGVVGITDLIISLALMAIGHGTGGSRYTGFYYFRYFLAYGLVRAFPAGPVILIASWQMWWWNRAMILGWRLRPRDWAWLLFPALGAAAGGCGLAWVLASRR